MRRTLTDRGIAAMPPAAPGTRRMMHDAVVAGFAVLVTDKGNKSYVLYTRFPGSDSPSRRYIGQVGALPLATARKKAQAWRELIAAGRDPKEYEAAVERAEARRRANNFAAVAEVFIEERVKPQRTARDTEREIRKHLMSRWGSRPVTSINSDDVIELLDELRKAGIGAHAHNLFGHIQRLFKWGIARRCYDLVHNPCEGLSATVLIGEKVKRSRTLNNAELRALWKASELIGYPYGQLYRLLLLTGVRLDQAAGAQWCEFILEKRTWIIPASRVKQKNTTDQREHIVPITDAVAELLESLPRFAGGDYLFSSGNGSKPVDGMSRAKIRLTGTMEGILSPTTLPPFINHDIRRSVRSRLSELRVPPIVAEAVIGHKLPGLLGTYDLYEYFEEKRDALERWAAHLRGIVGTGPIEQTNIVAMRGVS